jgi:hypothetical protein
MLHRFKIYDKTKKYFNVKVGTERCWCAFGIELSPSQPNKGWNNPRGKNGRFIATKKSSLEQRIAALEKKFEALGKVVGGNV